MWEGGREWGGGEPVVPPALFATKKIAQNAPIFAGGGTPEPPYGSRLQPPKGHIYLSSIFLVKWPKENKFNEMNISKIKIADIRKWYSVLFGETFYNISVRKA